MGKAKKETGDFLLMKNRLRAKELILSEEYKNDILRHDYLYREYEKWKKDPLRFSFENSDKVRVHSKKGSKLRNELISSYDNILKKYSISRPVSLELLKRIADGEVRQEGLRHRDEVPVKMLLPDEMCRTIKFDGYEVDLNSKECFSIEINPRGSKTDILHYISKLLDCCTKYGIEEGKRFREDSLDILEDGEKIYHDVQAGKKLSQIAKERCGINKNPAYDPIVKAEYEKVRRNYKKVKELKEK